MSEFEKVDPELATLFLRLDAAAPTDPVLRAAAEAWQDRRRGALLPPASLLQDLPDVIRPHVFLARVMVNGQRDWMFTGAGAAARMLIGAASGRVSEAVRADLPRRLAALFELVAHKEEPYAGMFELQPTDGRPYLCEAYAAPVAPPREGETTLLAALNCRAETAR